MKDIQQVTATTTDSIALMWKGQVRGSRHRQQQLAQEAELGRGGWTQDTF